ncbi:MAG TPA: hypothetical protein VFP53_09845 [Sphingomicrobium sp.]|nr:hypothetical protein [Sphingomicrobium sp.]
MSRALFVSLREGDVVARCLAAKVGISSIEDLPLGGVRFVCMSGDGAATMRKKLKSHLLPDDVVRQSHRPSSSIW